MIALLMIQMSHRSVTQATSLTYSNDFEAGTLTGLKCSGNCPGIVTSPGENKNQVVSFNLSQNMNVPFRSEITLGDVGKFKFEEEYWFGFKYYFDDWDTDMDMEGAPFQIHLAPISWENFKECTVGSQYDTGSLMMVTKNDTARFVTYGGKTLWEAPLQKRQWQSIVVHFRLSIHKDGFIEAWMDGVNIGRVEGANCPATDNCDRPWAHSYLKLGIYKWNWKEGRPATGSTHRQLLIDNLKIALGPMGYDIVNQEI